MPYEHEFVIRERNPAAKFDQEQFVMGMVRETAEACTKLPRPVGATNLVVKVHLRPDVFDAPWTRVFDVEMPLIQEPTV